ncbi:MAG: hypothetical protein HUU21_27695, partial [Polyangiaceae bacterium]|nr:hypothetical protein [Polyangiaceae bacterium]
MRLQASVMRPVKQSFPSKPEGTWASDLAHPLPIAAVVVLAVNDHLLKGAGILPGWVTGKLSDIAGLFFFPVLLAAVGRGIARALHKNDAPLRASLAVVAPLVTGIGFAAVKLSAFVNARVAAAKAAVHPAIEKTAADPVVPFPRLAESIALYRVAFERRGLDYAIWGHASDGNLHPNLIPRSLEDVERGREAV